MKKKKAKKKKPERFLSKLWYFIWEDDSLLSWIVNIILAFILIKFVVYPGLGLVLGTSHPIVAVVSGSMEHRMVSTGEGAETYTICGKVFGEKAYINFDKYWEFCGSWYEDNALITKEDFSGFLYKNGFNTGDLMILVGKKPKKIEVGEIIVFQGNRAAPIIHRVIKKWDKDGKYYIQTKGDHNVASWGFESEITEDKIIGKALIRVPLLGWIKMGFVKVVNVLAQLF